MVTTLNPKIGKPLNFLIKKGILDSMAMFIRCVLCMTDALGKSYRNLFPNSVQITNRFNRRVLNPLDATKKILTRE